MMTMNKNNNSADYTTPDFPAQEERTEPTKRQVGGAAVVGTVAGLCLGGPVLAVVGGVAAAAVATSNNKAGKVVRSGGDVAADAGSRLKKFDQKHKVLEKTSNQVVKGCKWVSKKLQDKPQGNPSAATKPTH